MKKIKNISLMVALLFLGGCGFSFNVGNVKTPVAENNSKSSIKQNDVMKVDNYKDSTCGFSFDYPVGWNKEIYTKGSTYKSGVFFYGPDKNRAHFSIGALCLSEKRSDGVIIKIEDLYGALEKELNGSKNSNISKSYSSVLNQKAITLKAEHDDENGIGFGQTEYIFSDGINIFRISYNYPKGLENDYLEFFQKTISSFKLNK